MKYILSILIPTIPDRHEIFLKLWKYVGSQIDALHRDHSTLGKVQLLVNNKPKWLNGGLSIGKKREALVMDASGKYLNFLDDDEDIAPNYVETLVRLCQLDVDVVTFRSFARTDYYWSVIDMRLGNPNEEATPERIVKRNAWHICPVKSEHAKKHAFEDSNYGEDWQWFERVLAHCKTEAHTDQIIHQYNHSSKTSEADKIIKQGYL